VSDAGSRLLTVGAARRTFPNDGFFTASAAGCSAGRSVGKVRGADAIAGATGFKELFVGAVAPRVADGTEAGFTELRFDTALDPEFVALVLAGVETAGALFAAEKVAKLF
jgi:hypothetical protein